MVQIPASTRSVAYAPVASVGPFPVPFPLFEATGADLVVYLDDVIVAGWTFAGETASGFYGAPNTYINGNVTFEQPISGDLVILGRRAPERQGQYAEGRGIPARDHNSEYNLLTAVDQELRRDTDQAKSEVAGLRVDFDAIAAPIQYLIENSTPGDIYFSHPDVPGPPIITSMKTIMAEGLTLSMMSGVPLGSGQNATAALQKLAYESAQLGVTGDIGFGDFFVDGPILFDEQEWADPLNPRGALRGKGQNATRLRIASGGFDAVTFDAGSTTGIGSGIVCSDFTLVKDNLDKTGAGIGLNRYAFVTFRDISIFGFDAGFFATDMLSSILQGLTIRNCRRGVTLQKNNFSQPNAITLDGLRIGQCSQYGVFASNPSNLNVRGGGIEGCGVGADDLLSFSGGIGIVNGGSEGGNAAKIDGVYFEFNAGLADLYIDQTINRATYSVVGCTFSRGDSSDHTINNIRISGGGFSDLRIGLRENNFRSFGDYVPNIGRQFVNPTGLVTVIDGDDNIYDDAGGDVEYRDMAIYGPNERRGRVNGDGTAKFLPRKWVSTHEATGLYKIVLPEAVVSMADYVLGLTLEGGNPGAIRAFYYGNPSYIYISITDLAGAALDAPWAFSFSRKG